MSDQHDPERGQSVQPFDIQAIDYIELYVSDAYQAADFYRAAYGFAPVAYAEAAAGVADRVSIVLRQGDIHFVLTSGLRPEDAISAHVYTHGDGVKDIAYRVNDAAGAYSAAIKHGARSVAEPTVFEAPGRRMVRASIATFGDTVHTLIERSGDFYLPGYLPIQDPPPSVPVGLTSIDHVAACVDSNTLELWVRFYQDVFGFHTLHEENVVTEYSAMLSKVVQNSNGSIKVTLLEPAAGNRRSQIHEYLEHYQGPGVQHIAVHTDDIISTIQALQSNGIAFRSTPGAYYSCPEKFLP